jgi:hypothetical protein
MTDNDLVKRLAWSGLLARPLVHGLRLLGALLGLALLA